MRARLLLLVALAACGLASQAAAKPDYPPGALDRRQQIMPHIGPVTRAWIAGEARRLADGTASDVTGDIRGADLGIPAGADIQELAFVVLMQATEDQDQDLQEIMTQVQAQTKAKQALRQQLQVVQADNAGVATNAVGAGGETRGRRIAGPGERPVQTSDISEQLQLKLQMAQQRYSQLMQMLSNVMRSLSDTGSAIIANLK
jgi:hypothetical protein